MAATRLRTTFRYPQDDDDDDDDIPKDLDEEGNLQLSLWDITCGFGNDAGT